MVDEATVLALLQELERRLERLRSFSGVTAGILAEDVSVRDQVERNFEVALQCCIDLGTHILASMGAPSPASYRDVFLSLGRVGIIDGTLSEGLAGMAGFKNVLVHGYPAVDPRRLREFLGRIPDVEKFAAAVVRYVEMQKVEDS